ncbi:MAG: ACP S-malonyltransferase [Sphingorhabdus sp.]
MAKETALVICPGRGTYNAPELGYLQRYHGGGGELTARLDTLRRQLGQPTISQLDGAEKFSPSVHMTGDNASLLIYACALADFAAIDRERFDIVAVTGNSMGWYLALACGGVLDFDGGARLVNIMGGLMHEKGVGGQIVWSLTDGDWRIDPKKQALAGALLTEAASRDDIAVHVSISLGGMLVFGADDAGLKWLSSKLPKDDRFPMRLNHHAAFHTPLLDHIVPQAKSHNPASDFGEAMLPLIDGTGRIWSPKAFDPADIYGYTFGAQINRSYNFTRAVQVAATEFAPDRIIVLGPGTTLGAPTVQSLIEANWRGFSGKDDFQQRQSGDPVILSMGIEGQRKIATG